MTPLLHDLRFGTRQLRRNPGFTLVVTLTLALGIGVNTAIFDLLDALVYRALPVPAPEELYSVTDLAATAVIFGSENGVRSLLSWDEFQFFQEESQVFRTLSASSFNLYTVSASLLSGAEMDAEVQLVSGHYFEVLGIPAQKGTTFGPAMDDPGQVLPVAVVSHAFWSREFGSSADIVGQVVRIWETPFQIVGVMPPDFFGETVGRRPDLWVPIQTQPYVVPGQSLIRWEQSIIDQPLWLNSIGRLRKDIEPERAEAELNLVLERFIESRFDSSFTSEQKENQLRQSIELTPASSGASPLRNQYRQPLQAMMWVVALVLLIACANVANLLLARGRMREREAGVRLALGAGRRRLLAQFLTESLLLAFLGGSVGLLLALWVQSLLVGVAAEGSLAYLHLPLDLRVLLYCFGIATLAGLTFGLIPAWRTSRRDLSEALKGSAGVDVSLKPGRHVGRSLAIFQIALSVLLLVVTGLFVRTLRNAASVDPGFDSEQLATVQLPLAREGYEGLQARNFVSEALERLEQLPGVVSATASYNGLFGNSYSGDAVEVEGYETAPGERIVARNDHVAPGYFATTGIEIVRGRELSDQDGRSGPRAGLINESFAREFFAGKDPIGLRVTNLHPDNPGAIEVVGIARDAKYNALREESRPRIYFPFFNPLFDSGRVTLLVRLGSSQEAMLPLLEKELAALEPGFERVRFQPMAELVDRTLQRERMLVRVSSLFGVLALLLAAIGIYGVLAHDFSRRAPEIGIRMALGASHFSVIEMVLQETLLVVGCGLALGIPAVLAIARLAHSISSQLYQVHPADPIVLIGAALLMALFAGLAAYGPARRAARVDPMQVLNRN